MLERIVIDGFLRIAEADLDLTSHRIHAFTGDNEAGKSSLVEAIAFCYRGLSPRVRLKGQFDELLFRGKKKGSVQLAQDGFDLTRNIKTGKLETTAPLDYHDLLVDIQLGREQFGKADPKELRQMMSKTFGIESTTKYIGERLEKKGITTEMVTRILPLLKAGGFETACETAQQRYLERRGAWEAVTGEKYGSVKATDWKPADADQYRPVEPAQLEAARADVEDARHRVAQANQKVGALSHAVEVQDAAEQLESIEDIETHLQSLVEVENAYNDELITLRTKLTAELESVDAELTKLQADILQAKMAAASLECPGCGLPLKVHTEKDKVSLLKLEGAKRREGISLNTLMEQLEEAKSLRADLVDSRTKKIRKIESTLIEVQADKTKEKRKLEVAKSADGAEPVTPENVIAAQQAVETANKDYEHAKSALAKLQSDQQNHASLGERKTKADALSVEAAQWSLAADLLSNKPESIPSELVQRTCGPINATLMQICGRWKQLPIVVDGSMTLSRGDGCKYYMLSESAKWRADVAIQLALAALGSLKLVAIDRFDVLAPNARNALFDMLEWFSDKHPDVSVIVTGTLKSKPDLGDNIKSWWIENGEVSV
jgi:chromosome segregation ATPase